MALLICKSTKWANNILLGLGEELLQKYEIVSFVRWWTKLGWNKVENFKYRLKKFLIWLTDIMKKNEKFVLFLFDISKTTDRIEHSKIYKMSISTFPQPE